MNLFAFLRNRSRRWVIWATLILVAVVGILDGMTGREVTLFLVYAGPIFLVTWYASRNWGIVIAVLSAVVWWAANLESHRFVTDWGYGLATITRLAYFLFVAIGGAALRLHQEDIQARLEALEKTRELEREIVRISEHAQQQIGQELHDGICQYFAAVACAASSLKADLTKRSAPEAAAASEIEGMLNEGVVQIRDLARGIFPVQMDEEGLPAALEDLVATSNRLMPVSVAFTTIGEVRIFDQQVSMHLYRIAQEALNNAVKHGRAQHIDISLTGGEESLVLMVSDDGRGFPQNAQPGRGMGLKTMQYRARAIGAVLSFGSSFGSGTTLICTVPVRTLAADDYAQPH